MKKLYLVTGADGHVGTVLVSMLLKRNETVRALVLPGRGRSLPPSVMVMTGDVTEKDSLLPFFDVSGYDQVTLIHCAGRITIASKRDPAVWKVNVGGTKNVLSLARRAGVTRVICVCTVHAIPELPMGEVITEVSAFSPELVEGQYAKSKAAAAQIALNAAKKGLNVSVVHPSGIIGPGDLEVRNHMIRTIRDMASGKIFLAPKGGYDFVDSRDVAAGILGCEEKGKAGECYILSGHYVRVLDLLNLVREEAGKPPRRWEVPYPVAKAAAPAAELFAALHRGEPPLFTPLSIYTLHTNGVFSHEKATRAFGYRPRPLEESVRDSLPGAGLSI